MKRARLALLCLLWPVFLATAAERTSFTDDRGWVRSRIPRKPVDSAGLAALGYSKRLQVLEIEFKNGAVYRYEAVPASIHRRMLASESKGGFYHGFVRGKYKSSHVKVAKRPDKISSTAGR